MPLIALGSGLGAWAVRLTRRDAPPRALAMVAAAGSFSSFSTLLGNPLSAAFVLMEATGLGGAMIGLVLVPGMVAAGLGTLIFVGLGAWTGEGTFSLAIPDLPAVGSPTFGEFGWSIVIGLVAVPVGLGIRKLAVTLQPHVERRMLVLTPAAGLVIAGLAILFGEVSGKSSSLVLFSGQDALGPFLDHQSTYTVGTLVLLFVCKALAYGVALSCFRGGPIFPSLFVGAVGGEVISHLPGLDPVTGAALGMAAMTVVMLRFPLTAVLIATILLGSNGIEVMPLVIITVAVAYVTTAWLTPPPPEPPPEEPPPPAAGSGP